LTAAKTSAGSEGRLLIVDDSPVVLELLSDKLQQHGYQVTQASSGAEALSLAMNGTWDLFIVDVKMPGIDGLEVTRRLRAHPTTAQVPTLLLTSLDSPRDTARGLQAGADDFLSKSVGDAELIARLRSLVALGRLRERMTRQSEVTANLFQTGTSLVGGEADAPRLLLVGLPNEAGRWLQAALTDAAAELQLAQLPETAPMPLECGPETLILTSLEALEHANAPPDGVIVVDEHPSVERRLKALDLGAEDYLPRDAPLDELVGWLQGTVRRHRRVASMAAAREQAVLAALTDPLTGLFNRTYLQEHLRAELARTRRYEEPFALIMVDIDRFKRINDTYGHQAGDEVLRMAAQRLRGSLRATDFVARYGGEEFCVILPHTTAEQGAVVAEKIRRSFADVPFTGPVEDKPLTVTVSVGAAFAPVDGLTDVVLVGLADQAMYTAKGAGRNQVVTTADASMRSRRMQPRVPTSYRLESTLLHVHSVLEALLSNDLKSPLNAVGAAAKLMQRKTSGDHPLRPFVRELEGRQQEVVETLKKLQHFVQSQLPEDGIQTADEHGSRPESAGEPER